MAVSNRELSWFAKYQEAVKELTVLRKENDKLHSSFSAMAADHAKLKFQLNRVKEALHETP